MTPIKVNRLKALMIDSAYDVQEREFLLEGFTHGFRLGYQGPRDRKIMSNNLRFRVGDKFDLWDKVMTEVAAGRYAGPYDHPDQVYPGGYMVNPCGLTAKSGNRTRLINHYSYPHGSSVNDFIPEEYSKVKYQDLQDAVNISLDMLQQYGENTDLHYSRTDAANAFRVLPISNHDRHLQMLKAENPRSGKWCYFIDLCCGFDSSSSCFLYDKISKLLRHLYRWKSGFDGVVYLDDALQIGFSEQNCNSNLQIYLQICADINLPIAHEKTERVTKIIIFLGMLINAFKRVVGIPQDKIVKALNQLDYIIGAKKVTVLQMQQITGLLNFFNRAIIPGRAFTRRLYSTFADTKLRQHHHIQVTRETKLDMGMWREFLPQETSILRPFVNFTDRSQITPVAFTTDATKSAKLGFAACWHDESNRTFYFCYKNWDPDFIEMYDPSIQFLELFALTVGIFLYSHQFRNRHVQIFCDNQAVVQMVNNDTSSCRHCMILIRLIVLYALRNNVRYTVKYISSRDNKYSDLLSRMRFKEFFSLIPRQAKPVELRVPPLLLPLKKFFANFD